MGLAQSTNAKGQERSLVAKILDPAAVLIDADIPEPLCVTGIDEESDNSELVLTASKEEMEECYSSTIEAYGSAIAGASHELSMELVNKLKLDLTTALDSSSDSGSSAGSPGFAYAGKPSPV
uniref:Uncharacterized protein n=1 Tax=Rhodosorus marinus TaxID=101924 RepID=A0A7S0BRP5_9RHOD|mmetsp:Transcript_4565/g.6330  ORF Transcript_4565/g.6330 Transcript_4565/m.6330 type:complete len:122 (+) Transcript_4565:152-517(+)|eukprot:CAMPEP_0184739868 /NCGR_PEP_ID=MMETSP0315-20130426/2783_1 /TAXON_ID=101924 /ORGANISM="Rhodosorus marinus, Strain UTEX LB 2760" /LENGTH=121 /DNA_ID=CAMNT_0027209055 /DNA_START=82 /DNA_END=447 /DNA_ORIENTATION=+